MSPINDPAAQEMVDKINRTLAEPVHNAITPDAITRWAFKGCVTGLSIVLRLLRSGVPVSHDWTNALAIILEEVLKELIRINGK